MWGDTYHVHTSTGHTYVYSASNATDARRAHLAQSTIYHTISADIIAIHTDWVCDASVPSPVIG